VKRLTEETIIAITFVGMCIVAIVAMAVVDVVKMTRLNDGDCIGSGYTVDGLALVPLRPEQMHDLVVDDGCEVQVASCTPHWHDKLQCYAVVDCGKGPGE